MSAPEHSRAMTTRSPARPGTTRQRRPLVKYAHLGAGVERKIRQRLPQQIEKPPVLHQHGIHPPRRQAVRAASSASGQLPGLSAGCSGVRKTRYAPEKAVPDEAGGKFLIGEVFGAPAGVEVPPAQIHRAAAALHGGPQSLRRPGRDRSSSAITCGCPDAAEAEERPPASIRLTSGLSLGRLVQLALDP